MFKVEEQIAVFLQRSLNAILQCDQWWSECL